MVKTLRRHIRGTTLIEILVVLLLSVVIVGLLTFLSRDILTSTSKGIISSDAIIEARRILESVRIDLQNQCAPTQTLTGSSMTLAAQLEERGLAPLLTYRFHAFSQVGAIGDNVPESLGGSGISPRRASLVTYTVQPAANGGFPFRLVRQERFHPSHPLAVRVPGGQSSHVLSTRISFFEIRPCEIRDGDRYVFYYQITLQLLASSRAGTGVASASAVLVADARTTIVDVFETACPVFLMSWYRNAGYHRAWHAGIEGPHP